jgi:acetaldehyde dehydrogenase (acetylating)
MYASARTPIRLKRPLGREKLAPVTSLFAVQGDDEALALNNQLLVNEGAGHTAIAHTGRIIALSAPMVCRT